MCEANALERHRPTSWSVVMEGVGEMYEWSKNWHSFRMSLGLGKVMIHEYITVAFGFDGGERILRSWGLCQKGSVLVLVQII
jgi:hypothetical protein